MTRSRKDGCRLTARSLWRRGRTTSEHLDEVLGATVNLPLRYWQPAMLFSGTPDDRVHDLTEGRFPARMVKNKTHPVFSLQALPDQVGFRVCPCTSSRPWRSAHFRYIRQGCVLEHTGRRMDRDSFLVEDIIFNIPADLAFRLRFRGQVPQPCLIAAGDRVDEVRP